MALDFTGATSDVVTITDATVLQDITAGTIWAWVYHSPGSAERRLFEKSTNFRGEWRGDAVNGVFFQINGTGGNVRARATFASFANYA